MEEEGKRKTASFCQANVQWKLKENDDKNSM